jgi:hypothetical protein
MREPNIAPFFACAYPGLADVARKHGYCLAIHGSVITDLDLVAVPWTDEAVDAETLKNAIMELIGALDYRGMLKRQLPPITEENLDELVRSGGGNCPETKPHGRLAWNLYLYHGVKIDLSVMPRSNKL